MASLALILVDGSTIRRCCRRSIARGVASGNNSLRFIHVRIQLAGTSSDGLTIGGEDARWSSS